MGAEDVRELMMHEGLRLPYMDRQDRQEQPGRLRLLDHLHACVLSAWFSVRRRHGSPTRSDYAGME